MTDPIERAKALLAQYPDCAAHIFIDVPDLRALLAEVERLGALCDSQALEIAGLYSQQLQRDDRIRALEHQRDGLDCSIREGAGVYHCPQDAPCGACVMRRRIRALEAERDAVHEHLDAQFDVKRALMADNAELRRKLQEYIDAYLAGAASPRPHGLDR